MSAAETQFDATKEGGGDFEQAPARRDSQDTV